MLSTLDFGYGEASSSCHPSGLTPAQRGTSGAHGPDGWRDVEAGPWPSDSNQQRGFVVPIPEGLIVIPSSGLRQNKLKKAERLIHHLSEAQRSHPVIQVLMDYHAALEPREQANAATRMHVATYNVEKLVTPVRQETLDEKAEPPQNAVTADYDTLVNLITQTIEPKSWSSAGGEAAIQAFPSNFSLVIKQTQKGHEAVSELLQRLNEIHTTGVAPVP